MISNPQNATNAWGCDAVRGTYVLVQQAKLDRTAPDLLGSLSFTQKPTPPLLLRQRPCPPPLTRTQFHTYLDHQLQHVLSQKMDLSPSQLAALHRTSTLWQIARVVTVTA